MRIDALSLTAFRNYAQEQVEFHPECNVILGENAQGKTNLLEAISYLSCGKSPRARTDREMIRFGENAARMEAAVFARDREFRVRVDLYRDRRRKMSVNQVAAKTSAQLSQVYNTVFFCPEDLYLIREGAAARRRFLDTALCQLRPRYAAALAQYNRAHEHKTRILRDAQERPDLLAALPDFSERMGAVVIHYRAQFAQRLAEYAAVHHGECSGGKEQLGIVYQTVSAVTDPMAHEGQIMEQLRAHMEAHRTAELASRTCLSGPHKDDLLVTIDGLAAKDYASQGQTRTAALALKLAEREIFLDETGEYPILLLDDVLSELDGKRQEFVLNRIGGGQTLITCCEDEGISKRTGGRVLFVEKGRIR